MTQPPPIKYYHELTIVQKINVKANIRACIEQCGGYKNENVYVAKNDQRTWQYDTPFYFDGPNRVY